MKYGITVQQPPRCGSRCATLGTDMSYEMSRSSNQSWRRYMAPDRNPRLPNSRPRALILPARRKNCSRSSKQVTVVAEVVDVDLEAATLEVARPAASSRSSAIPTGLRESPETPT